MVSIFGEVQNVEGPLDAGHFAGGDADPHIRVKGTANDKEALIAAVLDSAFVDHEYTAQRVIHNVDGRHAGIGCERQRTGEQQTRLDRIKAKLASLGETRGIRAEGVSVIGRNPARELGDMNAKLQVFPRFDN